MGTNHIHDAEVSAESEVLMYGVGATCCGIVLAVYFVAMAICHSIGILANIFSFKSALCVVLGSILGIFVSGLLFETSSIAGYIGMGASIALMYVLFFSGVISALINKIPENVRNGFRIAFQVLRVVLILAAIVAVVIGILSLMGV